MSSQCFIKVNGVWKQGQVFSKKDEAWKTVLLSIKSNGVYR